MYIRLLRTVVGENGQQFEAGCCLWVYVTGKAAVLCWMTKVGNKGKTHKIVLPDGSYEIVFSDPNFEHVFPAPELERNATPSDKGGDS